MLAPAAREAALAALDVDQARLYNNPTLDVGVGTFPVGRLTPPDLDRPYANVPNYGAGLAYTFPLKKRGPRQQRAQQLSFAAHAEVDLAAREATLALASVLGDLATATLREEGMHALVAGGERSLELAEARLRTHFGTPLEVDRLRVELERTRQQVLSVEAESEAALAECAQLLGTRCETFEDAGAARAYLLRWAKESDPSAARLQDRPDLRALDFQIAATRAEGQLAAAEAVPDPTVRLGYLHDRFIVAGNQRNSINLSVSVPLAVFDHGQVRQRAASSARRALIEERTRRVSAAHARIPTLVQRLTLQRTRCGALTETLLPQANAVLHDLEHAVENQLLPLSDVLQARRGVAELLIEEAESCGDAYQASLELLRELPPRGESR
jgi:cobalt-zinc-cadmium efflux system outer membrane protein